MTQTGETGRALNPALEGPPFLGYLKFAVPSVIALMAVSAAPIVDGLFIANYLGVEALAAVNLVIPVLTLAFGVPYMIAIGGSVSCGKFIGEKNREAASDVFSKTVIIGIVYSLALVFGGALASEELFAVLGAGPDLYPLMQEYFGTLLWFLPVQIMAINYYYFVRISGFPTLASTAIVTGVITNIVLNYVLIGVLGFGLRGAAFATGISALVMLVIMLGHWFSGESWLRFNPFPSEWRHMLGVAYNGLSEFIDESSSGFVTFILNLIVIGSLGYAGVAAFSVVSYSLFIGFLFFYGLSEALQAVCSQCYGARDEKRMRQFLVVTAVFVISSALLFSSLLLAFGENFILFFIDPSETELISMSKGFIAILWPIFVFAGLNFNIAAYLTAVHQPTASAIVAILRAAVFPLGLLYILTEFYPDIPFLVAITAGEMLTLIVTVFLFIRYRPSALASHLARARMSR